MRLFVALELTEAVRRAVTEVLSELKPAAGDLRWVRPESMHITLKFMGHVEESQLAPVRQALASVHVNKAVEMNFQGLGFFPNQRRPRVLWIGIHANPALAQLAGQIETSLEPLGIQRENRPFSPHLTLARFPHGGSSRNLKSLQERMAALPSKEFGYICTREFHLIQSQLSPSGAKYTTLERFAFARTGKEN